uniref:Uncharacterized protein n=1 Tax=Rhodnius prolixus TaxID=13249 RepID=T1I6D3_RHOPR
MGNKMTKPHNEEQSHFSGQRVFLCEHCYRKTAVNANSSICRNCGNINLHVCFYPFSEPIIPIKLKPKQDLFQDSLESLYANMSCCGIIKRTDEKSFNNVAEQELPPKISPEDFFNSDLFNEPKGSIQYEEQRFCGIPVLFEKRNQNEASREVSVYVSPTDHLQVDHLSYNLQDAGPTPLSFDKPTTNSVPTGETAVSSKTNEDSEFTLIDPDSSTKLDKDCSPVKYNTLESCSKQEVTISVSQTDLSLTSIHLTIGSNDDEEVEFIQCGNDSVTFHFGTQEVDSFEDWENFSEFMIDLPLYENDSLKPREAISVSNGMKLNSCRTRDLSHCIMSIDSDNIVQISLLREEIDGIVRCDTSETMQDHCKETLQNSITQAITKSNNKTSSEQVNVTELLNSISEPKLEDCDVSLRARRQCPFQVTEGSLFLPKSLNNDDSRCRLPSIINEDSFYRSSLQGPKDSKVENRSNLKIWSHSFENVLQFCHCNKELLDCGVYHLEAKGNVQVSSYSQTYIAKHTINPQFEFHSQNIVSQKGQSNFVVTDQDNIALNESIPLQLQGTFPNEGSAFYISTNLDVSPKKFVNVAHTEEQVVNVTVSGSTLSLVEAKDENSLLKKVFSLVENIINELLPYFSVEIIHVFKRIDNPFVLDILMSIIRDLKAAKCIIQLVRDIPYRFVADSYYLLKIQKLLGKVISGLQHLENEKMYWPKSVQSKRFCASVYDFNLDIFESLKSSVCAKPITRSKSLPLF